MLLYDTVRYTVYEISDRPVRRRTPLETFRHSVTDNLT
jgi:hypothetical protein